MTGRRSFAELRAKMSPKARAKAEAEALRIGAETKKLRRKMKATKFKIDDYLGDPEVMRAYVREMRAQVKRVLEENERLRCIIQNVALSIGHDSSPHIETVNAPETKLERNAADDCHVTNLR